MNKTTTLVMLTWNALNNIKMTIDSLYVSESNFWLIIMDNGSTQEVIDYLKELERNHNNVQVVLNNQNLGVWNARIRAARMIDTDVMGTIDSDLYFSKGWLKKLELSLLDENVGQVGPLKTSSNLKYPFSNNSIRQSWNLCKQNLKTPAKQLARFLQGLDFDDFSRLVIECNLDKKKELPIPPRSISTCAMITYKEYFLDPNLNDEQYSKNTYGLEDIDYSWSLFTNGIGIKKDTNTYVHHFEHSSLEAHSIDIRSVSKQNTNYFSRKWSGLILDWIDQQLINGLTMDVILEDEIFGILKNTELVRKINVIDKK